MTPRADRRAEIAERFIDAFSAADIEAMRELLDDGLTAYVTNSDGGMDEVTGRDPYLERIEAMDLPSARFSVELTQEPVTVGDDQVLLMVEIRAERGDRKLHNFAAHLLRIDDGRIAEWRMTDAKPAESDAFWG
jgi:ketosteroid isomerase-like protein